MYCDFVHVSTRLQLCWHGLQSTAHQSANICSSLCSCLGDFPAIIANNSNLFMTCSVHVRPCLIHHIEVRYLSIIDGTNWGGNWSDMFGVHDNISPVDVGRRVNVFRRSFLSIWSLQLVHAVHTSNLTMTACRLWRFWPLHVPCSGMEGDRWMVSRRRGLTQQDPSLSQSVLLQHSNTFCLLTFQTQSKPVYCKINAVQPTTVQSWWGLETQRQQEKVNFLFLPKYSQKQIHS